MPTSSLSNQPILIHEPALMLADEQTGRHILDLLLELTRDAGKTLVMATHNPEIVPLADRICRIRDGQLVIAAQEVASEPV